jgi:head-tail adaptor
MKPRSSIASRLKDRVRIERPVADDSFDGAGSGEWSTVQEDVSAEIVDELPSRDERIANGMKSASRRSRLRLRYRTDITSGMRFVETTDDVDGRILDIVGGPARLGRELIEFMVEEYSPAGNAA